MIIPTHEYYNPATDEYYIPVLKQGVDLWLCRAYRKDCMGKYYSVILCYKHENDFENMEDLDA